MSDLLLWIILLGTILNTVLAALILSRTSMVLRGAAIELRDELRIGREEARNAGRDFREEVSNSLNSANNTLSKTLDSIGRLQQSHLDGVTKQLKELIESNQGSLDRMRTTLDSRVRDLQDGNEKKLEEIRKTVDEKLHDSLEKRLAESFKTLSSTLGSMGTLQQGQLDGMTRQLKELTDSNQGSLDRVRTTLDSRVRELQEGNERKLDEMRKTVDEKLHDTLEKRLGESFKLVSDRLESVHKGLGDMQNLATGVGDLKRVLTNVKARGTWAEVQVGAILEQILTTGQYEKNVRVKDESSEAVEYAVRLPGPKEDRGASVWLPIDSKFPQEDYLRVQEAAEKADADAVQKATEALVRTIRTAAKDIHDKYVNPPSTTDFGIMFLATEGLYAEVLRQPALVEDLLHRYRVVVAGPTTLAAILSSLRMGFQTLAIEQRAAEVWKVLGAVKTEFGKFGEVLDKVKRQLSTASRTIEETDVRTRAMERRLRSVEHLPEEDTARILELPAPSGEVVETEAPEEEATANEEKTPV